MALVCEHKSKVVIRITNKPATYISVGNHYLKKGHPQEDSGNACNDKQYETKTQTTLRHLPGRPSGAETHQSFPGSESQLKK